MLPNAEKPKLSLTSMSPTDAARLLTAVGGKPVTEQMLQADRAAGAPTNPDGTVNLVDYGAWLVKEMSGAD